MSLLKKTWGWFLVGIVSLAVLFAVFHMSTPLEVDGYFSDFYIEQGMVYFEVHLCITNHTNQAQNFSVTAVSQEDYESGLLASPDMVGYNAELRDRVFSIGAKEKKNFDLVLTAKHGGYDRKQNRLLPELNVQIVD